MKRVFKLAIVLFLLTGRAITALCQTPSLTSPDLWKPEHAPFSFTYDGKSSATFLSKWQVSQETAVETKGEPHRYYYRDPVTHLAVIAEIRLHADFPGVIDWVLRFRNEGTSDTPIIENILQALMKRYGNFRLSIQLFLWKRLMMVSKTL